MFRRAVLPIMVALAAAGGFQQPMINVPGMTEVRRTVQRRIRFGRSVAPRTRKKHERQRPPHKNCQHRKPARARRRKARLRRAR